MTSLPSTIAAFDDAQRRTLAVLDELIPRVAAGASVKDVETMARDAAHAGGASSWYHPPEVAVGASIGGGVRARLATLRPRPLLDGDLVSIDLAPCFGEAYGDAAVTICVGGVNPPAVLDVARACTEAACGFASRWKTVGEIHVFARAWAINRRMDLADLGAVGHRVLPCEGVLATGFPRSAHLATALMRNRIHRLNPVRMQGMFAIRPVLRAADGTCAAFEEIVWIDGEHKRVLGRDVV